MNLIEVLQYVMNLHKTVCNIEVGGKVNIGCFLKFFLFYVKVDCISIHSHRCEIRKLVLGSEFPSLVECANTITCDLNINTCVPGMLQNITLGNIPKQTSSCRRRSYQNKVKTTFWKMYESDFGYI